MAILTTQHHFRLPGNPFLGIQLTRTSPLSSPSDHFSHVGQTNVNQPQQGGAPYL